ADGTLDNSFVPSASISPQSIALQADGRILVAGPFAINRLNPDGTLDPSFTLKLGGDSPWAFAINVQADGRALGGGSFASLDGGPGASLDRLTNDGPILDDLKVDPTGDTITWMRNGVGPEAARVTFEGTMDGVHWTPFGEGVRIRGGWELRGVGLPWRTLFTLRARGWYSGGYYNSSGSVVETSRLIV